VVQGMVWWQNLRSWYLTLRAASHRHFGNLYADLDSYQKAIWDLTLAIQLNADNVDALVMRGTLYWRELDDPVRAVRDFDRALELDSRRWDALLNRGFAHQSAGDVALALTDLDRYARDGPDGAWKETAEALRQQLRRVVAAEENSGISRNSPDQQQIQQAKG
jgi:regulator of sirC expression with transglutaminase-like and TPR domain